MMEVKLRLGDRRPTLGVCGNISLAHDRILRNLGASLYQPDKALNDPFDKKVHYSVPMPMARRLFNRSPDPTQWKQPAFMFNWSKAIGNSYGGLYIEPRAYEYYKGWLEAEKKIGAIKRGELDVIKAVLKDHDVNENFFHRPPKPHQEAGLAFFLVNYDMGTPHILLFDEMRTGKTKQMIDIAKWLFEQKIISNTLIICPNTIKRVWLNELDKDAPLFSWMSCIVRGAKAKRRECWNSIFFFYIVNFESARADYRELYEWQKNRSAKWLLLVDEAHKLKNPDALQTKAILGHKSLKPEEHYDGLDPDFSVFATGTPVSNAPVDAFTIADFTCPGILNQNQQWFNIQFAVKGGRSGKDVVGYKNLDEIRWRLARTSMRRKRADVVFDETIISPRIGEMQDDQAEAYSDMAEMLYAELMGMDGEMTAVQARSHLSKILRLQQITSGYLSPEPNVVTWFKGLGWKIAELDELLDDYLDNLGKVVIWSRFVPPLFLMQDRYSKHKPLLCKGQMGEEAVENMYKFQRDPEYKIMLAQFQSAEGKGFQPATTAVLYDKWMSPHLNKQAADRIVGIENPVTVCLIPMITEGGIDERVEFLLNKKIGWSDAVTGDTRETEINLPVLDKSLLLYLLVNPAEARIFEEAYNGK